MELKNGYIYISLGLVVILLLFALMSNSWYTVTTGNNKYTWGLWNICYKNNGNGLICSSTSNGKMIFIYTCRILLVLSIILAIVLFLLIRTSYMNKVFFEITMYILAIMPIVCLIISFTQLRKYNITMNGKLGKPFLLCMISSLIIIYILLWNKKFPNIK